MQERFTIVSRYLGADGWTVEHDDFSGSYEDAGRAASRQARDLDARFGDSHFWTVDLKSTKSGGSFFQLFHGRLA